MLLTITKYGDTYEIYDLDDPNSTPVAYFKQKWRALAFMRRHEILR